MKPSTQNRPKLRVIRIEADELVADDHRQALSGEASDRNRLPTVLWSIAAHVTGLLLLALAIWLVGPSIAKAVLLLLATFILGAALFCVWGNE